jgi:acetylornithine deacetylase/succinyl-diaminopimelate desuccinylase-like protein
VKDMKGAALPFLLAYRDACRKGKVPEVSILLSTDEEIGGKTIPEFITKGLRPEIAFTPDTGSAVGIVVEHKGAVWAELRCEGSSGHGAMPWTARNPLMLLSEALSRIEKQYPSGTESDWRTTISPTILQGGDAQNRIPQLATAILDIRYPPEDFSNVSAVLQDITKALPEGCTLTVRESANPLYTDRNHPFISRYSSIVTSIEGSEPSFIREHGATDARHFCATGIPAFLYGPRGGGLHGSDEWVSLSSLIDQYHIYERLFTSSDSRGQRSEGELHRGK